MLTGKSVLHMVSQSNNEEPKETIIIRRCKMPEFATAEISDAELEKIISDLDSASDEDIEYLDDEELDDEDVPELSEDELMTDEDEYL
jgi:hypothetical protein